MCGCPGRGSQPAWGTAVRSLLVSWSKYSSGFSFPLPKQTLQTIQGQECHHHRVTEFLPEGQLAVTVTK